MWINYSNNKNQKNYFEINFLKSSFDIAGWLLGVEAPDKFDFCTEAGMNEILDFCSVLGIIGFDVCVVGF